MMGKGEECQLFQPCPQKSVTGAISVQVLRAEANTLADKISLISGLSISEVLET